MYNKILLASDGSKHAVRAAKAAAELATCYPGSFVEIVYVIDSETSKEDVLHYRNEIIRNEQRRQRLQLTEEVLKNREIKFKTTILHGAPGPMLIKYANEEKFDLFVIGSRGLNAMQEMVLGSVSHKIAKRVQCPVLIIK